MRPFRDRHEQGNRAKLPVVGKRQKKMSRRNSLSRIASHRDPGHLLTTTRHKSDHFYETDTTLNISADISALLLKKETAHTQRLVKLKLKSLT